MRSLVSSLDFLWASDRGFDRCGCKKATSSQDVLALILVHSLAGASCELWAAFGLVMCQDHVLRDVLVLMRVHSLVGAGGGPRAVFGLVLQDVFALMWVNSLAGGSCELRAVFGLMNGCSISKCEEMRFFSHFSSVRSNRSLQSQDIGRARSCIFACLISLVLAKGNLP